MGEESITVLLRRWNEGDAQALDQLFPLVYGDLKSLSNHLLGQRCEPQTLGRTALVHEVFLRLREQRRVEWNDRVHFLSAVARMMRQILVDHARESLAQKRWGGQERVPLKVALEIPGGTEDREILAVHEALGRLAELDPQRARLVELRYFAGLTLEEVAALDSVSVSAVKRDWTAAKLWLLSELRPPTAAAGTATPE